MRRRRCSRSGTLRCCLREQLRLLERGLTWRMTRQREAVQGVRTILTVLHQQLLVVDDGDVLLRQVADLPVLDLPQLFGDLRDETWKT